MWKQLCMAECGFHPQAGTIFLPLSLFRRHSLSLESAGSIIFRLFSPLPRISPSHPNRFGVRVPFR